MANPYTDRDFGGVRVSAATVFGNVQGLLKAEEAQQAKQALARPQNSVQLRDQLSEEEASAIARAEIRLAEEQAEEKRVFDLAVKESLAVKQAEAQRTRPEAFAYTGAVPASPTHPWEFSFGNPTPAETRAEASAQVRLAVRQAQAQRTWQFSFENPTPAEASAQVRPALSERQTHLAPQSPNFDCVPIALRNAYDMGFQAGKEEAACAADSSAISDARAAGFDAGETHGKRLAAAACENLVRQVEAQLEALKRELDQLTRSRG